MVSDELLVFIVEHLLLLNKVSGIIYPSMFVIIGVWKANHWCGKDYINPTPGCFDCSSEEIKQEESFLFGFSHLSLYIEFHIKVRLEMTGPGIGHGLSNNSALIADILMWSMVRLWKNTPEASWIRGTKLLYVADWSDMIIRCSRSVSSRRTGEKTYRYPACPELLKHL